jgi:siroheme synthase (precorrin-2 oxidase/ferrochelatase)
MRRGQLQIAISTGGQSPALAQRLRRELEEQFTPDYAGWLEELGENRKKLFDSELDADRRRDLLHSLASREAFDKRQTSSTRPERSTS